MQTHKPSNESSHLAPKADVGDERPTILLGIDGTGEMPDGDYAKSMKNSFVNYIVNHSGAPMKQYIRGPGTDGLDMVALIAKGYEFVHLHRFMHPNARVLLVGYSRGGAGVVGVAKRLKNDAVPVDGMVLFDPVNRSQTSSTDDVPNNALYMCQARRATLSFSRTSFNNCAVAWHHPTRCEIKYFWATHGGVGGVPWRVRPGQPSTDYISEGISELFLTGTVYNLLDIDWERPRDYRGSLEDLLSARQTIGNRTAVTYEEDRKGAHDVRQWIYPKLTTHGFLAKS